PLPLRGDARRDPKDKVKLLEKYRRAADLAGQLKFEEATALYREVLAEDNGMGVVWLQLAEVLVRQGRTEEAVSAYREVIQRNSREPGALIDMAGALMRLGALHGAPEQRAPPRRLADARRA